MKYRSGKILIIFILLATSPSVFSADIVIPTFELFSKGSIENGSFILGSKADITLSLIGGYKFGGNIKFSYQSNDLETNFFSNETTNTLEFLTAGIILKKIFSLPLNMEYFVGDSDVFCSGTYYPSLFGTSPIETQYSGYEYFGGEVSYEGIHSVRGTGIKLSTNDLSEWFYGSFFAYQDGNYGTPGHYSVDTHGMVNLTFLKFEYFLGGTWPSSSWGIYRTGLLLYLPAGEVGSFLLQAGIPQWDPMNPLSLNQFFFLFEPHIQFGDFSLTPTFFWHPEYYLFTETEELGDIDFNLDLRFGSIDKYNFITGVESNISIVSETSDLTFTLSPYLNILGAGTLWSMKVNFNLFPFSLEGLFDCYIGVKAEF